MIPNLTNQLLLCNLQYSLNKFEECVKELGKDKTLKLMDRIRKGKM